MSTASTHKTRNIILIALVAIISVIGSLMAINKIAPVSWGLFGDVNETSGVAIAGYDTVAYHTEGKAVKGSADNSFTWKEVNWHFASAENMALFQANPEQFAPQYGGYCAVAGKEGFTANAAPDVWQITDGKLYFFFDEGAKGEWKQE